MVHSIVGCPKNFPDLPNFLESVKRESDVIALLSLTTIANYLPKIQARVLHSMQRPGCLFTRQVRFFTFTKVSSSRRPIILEFGDSGMFGEAPAPLALQRAGGDS